MLGGQGFWFKVSAGVGDSAHGVLASDPLGSGRFQGTHGSTANEGHM